MHDRLISFDRVLNFRDFGGYETTSGARVARGRLYRSAHFAEASEADIEKLNALGVRVVVDLRRVEERKREPNRWPGERARIITNDEGPQDALPPHLQALLASDLTAASVTGYMHQLYRDFASAPRHIDLYRNWFSALLAEEGAAVIHCAAGKDRTGLGCALTLVALGVPEQAIYADYEFTNAAIDLDSRLPRIKARMEERLSRPLSDEALRPMLGVHVDYLRTAFDAIDAQYGSALGYMEQELGVGAGERAALLERLLE
ncbi:MAG: tyrosine-protein phosphatase [Hyphomonadaceae bacterium]|nr:tyrosine-protein phosphatase [Hyphomonadaceae bacterium]